MDLTILKDILPEGAQLKIAYSAAILLASWILHHLILKHSWKKTKQVQVRLMIRRILNTSLTIIVLTMLAALWIESFNQLGTFLGIFTAGIAIALKDLVVNIVGWLFIGIRRPFIIGDRIQIGDYSGDVIDIGVFQFTILEIGNWVDSDQSTGRIIHLPNGLVFSQGTANYTKGFDYIWNEIGVLLTFESDWRKAKAILNDIIVKNTAESIDDAKKQVSNASKRYLIHYSNLTPMIYTSVKESGVLLTIRYLCKPRNRRGSEHSLWEEILKAFAASRGIEFAYPTQRFYDRSAEK